MSKNYEEAHRRVLQEMKEAIKSPKNVQQQNPCRKHVEDKVALVNTPSPNSPKRPQKIAGRMSVTEFRSEDKTAPSVSSIEHIHTERISEVTTSLIHSLPVASSLPKTDLYETVGDNVEIPSDGYVTILESVYSEMAFNSENGHMGSLAYANKAMKEQLSDEHRNRIRRYSMIADNPAFNQLKSSNITSPCMSPTEFKSDDTDAPTVSNVQHTERASEVANSSHPAETSLPKYSTTETNEMVDDNLDVSDSNITCNDIHEAIDNIFRDKFKCSGNGDDGSPTSSQISLIKQVSDEHRERLIGYSQSNESNNHSQEYSTSWLYEELDLHKPNGVSSDAPEDIGTGAVDHVQYVNDQTLYEYCVVIGYDLMQNKPYVKSTYPAHKQPHKTIEKLAYPYNGAVVRNCDQEYCIILTDYPLRFYCFCRRVLPESFEFCIPLTYCLVTKHNDPKVFYKLLECIESQHGNGKVPEQLIERFHKQKLPLAGETLNLTLPTNFSSQKMLQADNQQPEIMTISRPKDIRLEKTELYDIYNCLGYDGLIHVFENLLLEKTVILFSEHISLLTSCIQGLLLILYPFQWHHIIVSVVPDDLQQMLDAPVPMLAGTLQPVSENIWQNGETCYVNLDKRIVLSMRREQVSVLPSELMNPLRVSLNLVKIFDDSKGLASVLIGDVFIRFFVELFSNIEPVLYEKSLFVESFENPETKLFLNWFLETVMFKDFRDNWHSPNYVSLSPSDVNDIDYTLFNSRVADKLQNKHWHTAPFDRLLTNSRLPDRKHKSIKSTIRTLFKKLK